MEKIYIIFSSEIILKSYQVRKKLILILYNNILNIIKLLSNNIIVNYYWDRLEIINSTVILNKDIIKYLKYIPGINKILIVKEFNFKSFKNIWQNIHNFWYYKIIHNKTFAIKVKKSVNYIFTSKNLEFYLGYKLQQLIPTSRVLLNKPDVLLEIKLLSNNKWIFINKKLFGINGFPIINNNKVLSLISGGFDSTLSSFLMLKKGCTVHFCYFNLYPFTNNYYIFKIIKELCKQTGLINININIVPFENISNYILNNIKHNYVPILIKILMIKISTHISQIYNIKTLVTGESLGQVSSQTLQNINIINTITNLTILRPLITYNKQEIIDGLKKLNLEYLCNKTPEYCGLFSKKKVTTAANIKTMYEEQNKIPDFMINDTLKNIKVININLSNKFFIKDKVKLKSIYIPEIIKINSLINNFIILDIRPKIHQIKNPFLFKKKKLIIISIPYIELSYIIKKLDKKFIWLLFCENNQLSYLQAIYLYNKGYTNVKILDYKL